MFLVSLKRPRVGLTVGEFVDYISCQCEALATRIMNNKTDLLKDTQRALGAPGVRATNQRALILDIIRQGHLDADEIYRQAREKLPRLSLSTVYRALRMFKKLGLVEELHFDESRHYYEVKPSVEHQHLVCLGCGKVVEFNCPLSRRMKKEVAQQNDFEVTDIEVRMTGYCSECRRGRK